MVYGVDKTRLSCYAPYLMEKKSKTKFGTGTVQLVFFDLNGTEMYKQHYPNCQELTN